MKLFTAVSIVTTLLDSTQAASLRGLHVTTDVSGPFDLLKCTFEARADEGTCHDSVDADGAPCDYCTVSSNGQEAGICVTSELADRMQQINPEVTCDVAFLSGDEDDDEASLSGDEDDDEAFLSGDEDDDEAESVELTANISSLQCTISAFTDEEKCAQVDNESCQYCQVGINGQEVGLCVDADVASEFMQVSDAISCAAPSVTTDVSGPFDLLKCTFEARADEGTCHDSVDADGAPCDYCTVSSNGQEAGICVTSELADRMKKINPDQVSCDIEKVDTGFLNASSVGDMACLKVGMQGGDADACRKTVDDTTGEHCTFCSSPNLDNIGLCMSSSYSGKHGRYYTCDAGDHDIIMTSVE